MMGGDDPIRQARIQVDAWGTTYASARALAGEVTAALSRYKGIVGNTTIHDCLKQNETDLYESESQARRVMMDFTLFYSEGE
jgi:hypothetical protein